MALKPTSIQSKANAVSDYVKIKNFVDSYLRDSQ